MWRRLAILVALAVPGGLLLARSGIVSVAASSGHYAITTWFLHYTMRQAVETQSSLVEVPAGVSTIPARWRSVPCTMPMAARHVTAFPASRARL